MVSVPCPQCGFELSGKIDGQPGRRRCWNPRCGVEWCPGENGIVSVRKPGVIVEKRRVPSIACVPARGSRAWTDGQRVYSQRLLP